MAFGSGQEQAVQELLELGADIAIHQTCAKCHQRSPLHSASLIGSEPVVDMLLQQAPNLMAPDIHGATALHLAALGDHSGVAGLLLASGADILAKDTYGKTPLHYASTSGGLETAKLLIENGADVNCLDQELLSPLHDAMRTGHGSIAKYLHDLDPTVISTSDNERYSYLHYAAMGGLDLLVKLLLDDGLNIEALPTPPADSKTICGTPLLLAARNGNTLAAKELLNHGANIEAICTKTHESSLHMAVRCDHTSIVKLLVERGASIEGRNAFQETPLISGSKNDCKSIEILLNAGADVQACDENGLTALHSAAIEGNLPLVNMLLKNRAHIEAQNYYGQIPLNFAVYNGSEPVVQLLLQRSPHTIKAR